MSDALRDRSWDVAIDNICYSADHAAVLCDALGDRARSIILLSTRAVYQGSGPFLEPQVEHRDYELGRPVAAPLVQPRVGELSYGEGKRQAEAYLLRHLPDAVCILRLPIIVGDGDYTGRLRIHVEHCRTSQPLDFGNLSCSTSFVHVDDVARALSFFALRVSPGIYNVASTAITLGRFREIVETEVGGSLPHLTGATPSPYGASRDLSLDCTSLDGLGFHCRSVEEYLPALIHGEVRSSCSR